MYFSLRLANIWKSLESEKGRSLKLSLCGENVSKKTFTLEMKSSSSK